eukprot:scaffold2543_cov246-Pinguiococcus_pyrenoidosus.AAC.1
MRNRDVHAHNYRHTHTHTYTYTNTHKGEDTLETHPPLDRSRRCLSKACSRDANLVLNVAGSASHAAYDSCSPPPQQKIGIWQGQRHPQQ